MDIWETYTVFWPTHHSPNYLNTPDTFLVESGQERVCSAWNLTNLSAVRTTGNSCLPLILLFMVDLRESGLSPKKRQLLVLWLPNCSPSFFAGSLALCASCGSVFEVRHVARKRFHAVYQLSWTWCDATSGYRCHIRTWVAKLGTFLKKWTLSDCAPFRFTVTARWKI